jgi:acyl phosphate:glycerol-3-phosphate acyltransferase
MSRLDALSPYAVPLLAAALIGYLLGALPFGYLVARANGVNIFEHGSRSPGATNVRRVLGTGAGNTVFVLDVLKGVAAAGWLRIWYGPSRPGHLVAVLGVVGLVAAMLGHSFSCFTRFRGGKGVATGAGAFLVLMPVVTLIGAAMWILFFFATRYVSLASLAAAATLPIAGLALHMPGIYTTIAAAVCVFVLFRHRTNIARLMAGTEPKSRPKEKR